MTDFRAPLTRVLDDKVAESVRRDHAEKITQIQKQPMVSAGVVYGVSLADSVATPVSHKLGRTPTIVIPSVIRGATTAGLLVENSRDANFVTLTASGFGATITLDLVVKA